MLKMDSTCVKTTNIAYIGFAYISNSTYFGTISAVSTKLLCFTRIKLFLYRPRLTAQIAYIGTTFYPLKSILLVYNGTCG